MSADACMLAISFNIPCLCKTEVSSYSFLSYRQHQKLQSIEAEMKKAHAEMKKAGGKTQHY